MKSFGKYITISLLLILGLFCVGVLYLFFIPNSSLFNVTYINHHKKYNSNLYTASEINHVVVNSRSYDVFVETTDKDEIKLEIDSRSFGFVLTKNEQLDFTATVKDKVLTFDIKEPYGAAVKNNSSITLKLSSTRSVDLTLNNTSATTTISSDKVLINNLNYSSKSGEMNFEKATINGKMNLNINKGKFTISKDVVTSKNDMTLKLTSGRIYAKETVLGDVEILKNNRGIITLNECERLTQNAPTAGGVIKINKASYMNFLTGDTKITVNEISQGADIEIKKSGSIKIGTLKSISIITTKSGNITIDNAESNLTAHSDTGNITVKKATTIVSTKTNYGQISVTFGDEVKSYSESADGFFYRVLNAEIKNGKLTAKGVDHLGIVSENEGIKVTGNGRINLTMNDVLGGNEVLGKNGSVNIVVNKDSKYALMTKSESGNVRVNLAQIIQYNGYTDKAFTQTNVNCETSTNTFVASTNDGDLKILDTNFAK